MTPDEYVTQVVNRYTVTTQAENYFRMLEPLLQQWAGFYLSRTFVSGSYAKGTAIIGSTDIDIFISLKSNYPDLRGMFENLFNFAQKYGWNPRKQNVSIGIKYCGGKIDLVPGRKHEGYQNWHSLYKSKQSSWMQTNVDLQIAAVKNSQRTGEIRAIKIWRNLRNLEFPSFLLELAVIEGLKYQSTKSIAQNILKALSYISDNIMTVRILDPGNTNNIISDDLTFSEKSLIALAARNSLNEDYWNQIIW